MRAKNMMLFVIAVGCGLVASIGVSQYMEHASGAAKNSVETAKIFVAVTDINIGEKLDAQNVKLEEWPKDRVPEGAIFSLEKLAEQYPRTRLYAGEPIMAAKLMDSNVRGSESITIPKGYRVVSVPVTVDTAVSGLLQPGDRVDLLVFFRKNQEIPETGTRTLLRDVNVFGVDGTTDRSIDADGQARNLRTVSLLVTPKQAETVMLGKELGTLFLSLRRPDDATEHISDGETVKSLLGTVSETANEKQDQRRENSDFAKWLNTQDTTTQPQLAAVAEPVWKMVVLSANGRREFEWSDENQLPTEVTDAHAAPMLPPNAAPNLAAPITGPAPNGATTDEDSREEGSQDGRQAGRELRSDDN